MEEQPIPSSATIQETKETTETTTTKTETPTETVITIKTVIITRTIFQKGIINNNEPNDRRNQAQELTSFSSQSLGAGSEYF
jgi:hypothetical protein